MEGAYDLVASLGANCAAAHNINLRGLRKVALPFDWTYVVDERPYLWLSEHLADDFSGLCLKGNLERILPDHPEWADAHAGFLKYIDRGSGFRFVNHFRRPIEEKGEYERVHGMLRRRIRRLVENLRTAKRVLFVLATGVVVSDSTLSLLRDAFIRRFPGVSFDFVYLQFGADAEGVREAFPGIVRRQVLRKMNVYDLERTNFEWSFLDSVSLSSRETSGSWHFSMDVWPKVRLTIDCRLKRKTGDA